MLKGSQIPRFPHFLALSCVLFILPWAICFVISDLMGIDQAQAMAAYKDFPVIWLDAMLLMALYQRTLSVQVMGQCVLLAAGIAIPWIILQLPGEPLQMFLACALVALAWKILRSPTSVFRVGVFCIAMGVLTVSFVHHVLFIYQIHVPETAAKQVQLESLLESDYPNWTQGPCEVKAWKLDDCFRFEDTYMSGFATHEAVSQAIKDVRQRQADTGQRVIGGVWIDNDAAPHWAMSFDGSIWQIAHWRDDFYEQVTFPMMLWLWVVAVTVWSIAWLMLVSWHQGSKPKERKRQRGRVGVFLGGLFICHVMHLWGLSRVLPGLIPDSAQSHPTQVQELTPQVQDALELMMGISLAGWTLVVLLIVAFHLVLFKCRKKKAKAMVRK